jgi:nitroreductase
MTHPKHAQADHDVIDLIRERWSPRAFDPDRSVPVDDLWQLFEAARWAPSSCNEQPWRFVVAHRDQSPHAYDALLSTLKPSKQAWAQTAPVMVLTAVKLILELTGDANRHAYYDTGQAVAFLTLQAQSQGLAIRQMEGFDHSAAREACQVPEGFEPAVVMVIGYPGSPGVLKNKNTGRPSRPRAAGGPRRTSCSPGHGIGNSHRDQTSERIRSRICRVPRMGRFDR